MNELYVIDGTHDVPFFFQLLQLSGYRIMETVTEFSGDTIVICVNMETKEFYTMPNHEHIDMDADTFVDLFL